MSRWHVAGLDGVRGLAILLVLCSHSVIYTDAGGLTPNGLAAGSAGVAIFFVLSGYLITTLLLREEERDGSIQLTSFYARRALRLFPALWLYLLVVFGIWLAGQLPEHPWHSLVTSLFYVRNLVGRGHETDHLWSLAIEEQFYLLWPVFLCCVPARQRTRLWIVAVALVAITLWRIAAAHYGLASSGALYIRTDFRGDAPLFGCAIALGLRAFPKAAHWLQSRRQSGVFSFVGVAGLTAWIGLRLGDDVLPGLDLTIVGLFGSALVLSQAGSPSRVSRWLTWRPLTMLGQISYGVYLWQQLFLGPSTALATIRVFPTGLLATMAVATLSFWCLERPILKFKARRFPPQSSKPPERVLAAVA
jgi:peptidoglycan/LPS O-acetylase OafA/YrhL